MKRNENVPPPSKDEVDKYLTKWDSLGKYVYQESSLKKLFRETYPDNTDIDDILIKVCSLNDFYSTNIYSPYEVARHIKELNIDKRLEKSDLTLVNDIAKVTISGKEKNFYSFATKYCSHHRPDDYPIYDNYVVKMLKHFKWQDRFCKFKNADLKLYPKYRDIINKFIEFYNLEGCEYKQIDRYLWQAGKEHYRRW